MRKFLLMGLILALGASAVMARGRRPKPEDGFPDYNRLEYHPMLPDPNAQNPITPAPTAPRSQPTVAPQTGAPGPDETVIKPPPPAVPLPADASEPPMPEEIISTLGSTATPKTAIPPNPK
jgi:hypothetical protein